MRKMSILIFILILFSCNKSNTDATKLTTDLFNYTDELKSTMKILSEKSDLCNFENEKVLVSSNKFLITNRYIMPFLYFQLLRYSVPISDYPKEDIEDFFYFTAESRGLNYALFLEALANGITASQDEIDAKVLEISGNDLENFKKNLEKGPIKFEFVVFDATQVIMIEKLKNEVVLKDITADEKEMIDFYEKNPSISLINPQATVRQILLKTNGLDQNQKDAKYKKIKDVLELTKTKDFSSLAKKYSEDEASKNSGGKLGEFLEKGKMLKEIEDVVFNTKAGTISDIFETEFGYHIIKVEKIKSRGKKKYEEIKDEIENILLTDKKNKVIDEFKIKIEGKYQIKVLK